MRYNFGTWKWVKRMIEKEKLREYAKKLMFEMKDSEYETLQEEFQVILSQMDLIGQIDGIECVEPMSYPYDLDGVSLREDVVDNQLTTDDIMLNVKDGERNQVKVPKVVE